MQYRSLAFLMLHMHIAAAFTYTVCTCLCVLCICAVCRNRLAANDSYLSSPSRPQSVLKLSCFQTQPIAFSDTPTGHLH